jgi:hypothetical protein
MCVANSKLPSCDPNKLAKRIFRLQIVYCTRDKSRNYFFKAADFENVNRFLVDMSPSAAKKPSPLNRWLIFASSTSFGVATPKLTFNFAWDVRKEISAYQPTQSKLRNATFHAKHGTAGA